jgi:peptide/nickel transport system substrate-binding protein
MNDRNPTNWTLHDDAAIAHAIRRGASRRDLLRMLMASGVTLAAGGAILGRAGAALAATPVRGGHIRAAGWSTSTADTLDPAASSLSTDYVRACAYYNRLTFLNGDSEIEMELAETIETTDAKTWHVRLRPGVTFHDGKPLTSADVVFSLRRHVDPNVGSRVNAIARQMEEITEDGPLGVRIVLAEPNADLPTILALHHFMIIADGTTEFRNANGTGAFRSEVFEPGIRSVGVRNENYFKGTGPHLDSFEFIGISDNDARVNALLSGDVHLIGAIRARSLRLLEGQPGIDIMVTTAGNYTNLNMRMDMDPGSSRDFVDGMKSLVDRELIVNAVMRGYGAVGNDQPVSHMNRYRNPNLEAPAFDPDKARFHFERAGLLGQPIPMVASDAATASVEMATIIQQAGSQIGVNLDVQRVPSDGYWSNYWLKAPVHFGNINPRPTPDILFSLLYHSAAPWNESRFENERFDSMLVEARGSLDEAHRTALYWEMQEIVATEAATIIPAYISGIDATNDRLKGMVPNPLGGMMGFAFAEYVWLDA